MPTFDVLEPAEKQFFHVEWECTLKCNLDCSYCGDGHNNSIPHPPLDESLKTIDFIFEYVSLYMKQYKPGMKHANLNVYGGESMFHPNIIEILEYAREKRLEYNDFSFFVSTITNAVVGKNQWMKIVELLDYFTISYHAESLQKQKDQVRENILYLQEQDKKFHVSIMMHPDQWDDCTDMVEWCKDNNVKYNMRQIDHTPKTKKFNYSTDQSKYLYGKEMPEMGPVEKVIQFFKNSIDLSSKGRECCGRRPLCVNQDLSKTQTFVPDNNFKGWSCSVNRYFLYVRQTTGEVFTNKDCRMNLNSEVGPIGYLNNASDIINELRHYVETNTLPVITCKKSSCWCGICTPKARTISLYNEVMERH